MAKKPVEPEGFRNRIIEYGVKPADQFLANPKNARLHPQFQRDVMKAALTEVGFVAPVVESKSGVLLDGHERVWQGLQNGNAMIPFVTVDVDESEESYVLATLDPITSLATYDAKLLDELLQEISTDQPSIQEMLANLADMVGLFPDPPAPAPEAQIDKAAELQEKWKVERGQLWQIGKHRLLCGDSTNADDVARVMDGEQARLLATDPPYNVGIEYGDSVDDEKQAADYETFSRAWFDVWAAISDAQIVTPGCNNLASWLRWFDVYHVAPWTKTNAMTNGKVSRWWCWEPVLFFGNGWKRARPNDVFDYPIGQQSNVANHPCPKPLTMWQDIIENYTDIGDIVADAFGGSGTTIVACEQLGRLTRAIELEPKYCAVILERMVGLGLDPELVDNPLS